MKEGWACRNVVSTESLLLGELPPVHGELLMLGFDVSERTIGSSIVPQRPYVRHTFALHHQDSVGGEIIAISNISSDTQEKAVPPRTARQSISQRPKGFLFGASATDPLVYPAGVLIMMLMARGLSASGSPRRLRESHRSPALGVNSYWNKKAARHVL